MSCELPPGLAISSLRRLFGLVTSALAASKSATLGFLLDRPRHDQSSRTIRLPSRFADRLPPNLRYAHPYSFRSDSFERLLKKIFPSSPLPSSALSSTIEQ